MSAIIQVNELSKKYVIAHEEREKYTTLRDTIQKKARSVFSFGRADEGRIHKTKEDFWALKGVSFDINAGDRVGIIGRNGAGKSTLLKIIARITEPTSGSIKINGRLASLLEVGTGFHPELTGRENIFLNGAILGMSRNEIRKKLDEIIAFAEVDRFLDTPVKRYSSGMYVRLAFSVAAHLDPEILLIDEVLAVGDASFQKKCLGKMEEVSANEGRTVLFVSHNMASVEALCNTGVYLKDGKIEWIGDIKTVVDKYLNQRISSLSADLRQRTDREGFGHIRLTKVCIINESAVKTGDDLLCEAFYEYMDESSELAITGFGMSVWTDRDVRLISLSTEFTENLPFDRLEKKGSVICRIKSLPLVEGTYVVNFFVSSRQGIEDYVLNCLSFTIEQTDFYKSGKMVNPVWGAIAVHHDWTFK